MKKRSEKFLINLLSDVISDFIRILTTRSKIFEVEASPYELPEGLEQMRFLHNRIPVKMIDVDYRNRKSMSGVDSPEDIERAEKIIAEFGEFNLSPE
ncbi:hypothetical protein ACIXNK_03280 [Bacteroides fragilis]